MLKESTHHRESRVPGSHGCTQRHQTNQKFLLKVRSTQMEWAQLEKGILGKTVSFTTRTAPITLPFSKNILGSVQQEWIAKSMFFQKGRTRQFAKPSATRQNLYAQWETV